MDGSLGPETNEACRLVAKGDKGLLVSILRAGVSADRKLAFVLTGLSGRRRLRNCSGDGIGLQAFCL
ncbi:MAG: hypothetical protein IJH64_15490 [Oscillospiraceae bacterium]|nr:hypothetical protein [Oscillospiraceae bacterium]